MSPSFQIDALLRDLLESSFGTISRVSLADALDAGESYDPKDLPKTYLYERIIGPNPPINEKTCARLCLLFETALSERNSRNRSMVANSVLACLAAYTGCENLSWVAPGIQIDSDDECADRVDPYACIFELLRITFRTCEGQKSCGRELLRNKLEKFLSRSVLTSDRMLRVSEVVGLSDVRKGYGAVYYPRLIEALHDRMDVLHVHGLAWWNRYEETIRNVVLSNSSLQVNVLLLDPKSAFVEPYAQIIGDTGDDLRTSIGLARNKWRKLFNEAACEGHDPAALHLYYGDWLPAKSLYRFDNTVVVVPKRNCKRDVAEHAYIFEDSVPGCAFRVYAEELESSIGAAVSLRWRDNSFD